MLKTVHKTRHWMRAALGLGAVVGFCVAAVTASAATPRDVLSRVLEDNPITETQTLPTAGGLMAVTAGGHFYILSKNGRFLFDGVLRDTWYNGRVIDSMSTVKRYAVRLDLDDIGLDFSQLVSVHFGEGDQSVTIFVTPNCPACRDAIKALKRLGETYTTRVVIVPEAARDPHVAAIDCMARDTQKLAALMGEAEAGGASCTNAGAHVLTTLTVAQLIGIQRLPFIIAPDGRVSQGLPRDDGLAAFLTNQGKSQ